MFRKMRYYWKAIWGFDFMYLAAEYAAGLILGIFCLVAVLCRGEFDQILLILGWILPILAVSGFGYWVYRDAKRSGKELREERRRVGRKTKPRPDGDMSEVAGMPLTTPWGGVER